MLTDFLRDIMTGKYDNHLSLISQVIGNRRNELANRMKTMLLPGDRVKLTDTVRPNYLQGAKGTVVRHLNSRILVRLDYQLGRFSQEIRCPISTLEKVA